MKPLSPRARVATISASLLLMIPVGHDLWQRAERAEIAAEGAAADRAWAHQVAVRGEIIDGPAVVGAYFRQGYAWAEAHGITDADRCPSESRAYRDGCRAFVATRR